MIATHGAGMDRIESDRIQYSVHHGAELRFVVAEFSADGTEHYFDSSPFEVRWYPRSPSEQERAEIRRWLSEGKGRHGWSRLTEVQP
jgi:hypothetical protein